MFGKKDEKLETCNHGFINDEQRFSKVFNLSPQPMMLIRFADSKILEVNDAAVSLLGFSRCNFLGNRCDELNIVRGSDKEILKILLNREGKYSDVEIVFYNKEGQKRYGIFSGDIIDIDGEQCLIQTISDITDRKHGEIALRRSEENYRLLAENMHLGVITVDLKGNITYINAFALGLLGSYSREITSSLNLFTFQPIIDAGITKMIMHCIEDGKACEFEIPYTSIWNKSLYLHLYLNLIKDVSDRLIGVQILAEDISERKFTEIELEDSEKKYRAMFEYVGAAIVIVENDFTLSFINQSMIDMTGYLRDEIEGKMKLTNFISQEDVSRVLEAHIHDGSAKKKPFSYEVVFSSDKIDKDLNVLINVAYVPGSAKTVASIIDVSDRTHFQKAFKKESKARLKLENFVNQGPVVLFLFDDINDWNVKFISENINKYGYESKDFLSGKMKFLDIVYEEDSSMLSKKFADFTLSAVNDFIVKYRVVASDNSIVWVENKIWLNRNKAGNVISYQGMFFDITNRKIMEDNNFELYRHLGLLNRRVSILADLNRKKYTDSEKDMLDSITRSARNLSQAEICLCYDYLDDKNLFTLLSADLDRGIIINDDAIKKLMVDDFNWLKNIMDEKKRFQGDCDEYNIGQLNLNGIIKSFLFLPMIKDSEVVGGLFLGFINKSCVSTQELAFYDLFVMHVGIMLKEHFIDRKNYKNLT